MHIRHPNPLTTSYKNHQKSVAFQSFGTISFILFNQKANQRGGGGGMAQCSPLNTLMLKRKAYCYQRGSKS